jgi:hypothetical protein
MPDSDKACVGNIEAPSRFSNTSSGNSLPSAFAAGDVGAIRDTCCPGIGAEPTALRENVPWQRLSDELRVEGGVGTDGLDPG